MVKNPLKQVVVTGVTVDFHKPFLSNIDKNFLAILAASFILEIIFVSLLSRQPVTEYSQREIAQIQERFAEFILGDETTVTSTPETFAGNDGTTTEGGEAVQESGTTNETPAGNEGEGEGSGGGESAEVRAASRIATASAQRNALSQQVSSKGILGVLSSSSEDAQGGSVFDFLGSQGGQGAGSNLDEVLSSADGLKTSGKPVSGGYGGTGGTAKGGRSNRTATIEDLVTETGGVGTKSLDRMGDIEVETVADAAGRGHKNIYRTAQEIQRIIYDHISAITYCYERELKRFPNLKGKVTVRITVHPDGYVEQAEILSSTLNNERVERCILTRIKRWKDFKPIDQKDGSVTFRQTFSFGY